MWVLARTAFHRDPRFIREFKEKYCVEVFAEHVPTKKKYVNSRKPISRLTHDSSGGSCGAARIVPS